MQTQFVTRLLICVGLAIFSADAIAQEPDAAIDTKIAERDRLSKKAFELANAGKLDEATAHFEQVYSLEESVFGPTHPELLGTLNLLAQLAALDEDIQAGIAIRTRQHAMSEQLYGKDDYRTRDAYLELSALKQELTFSLEDRARLQQSRLLRSEVVDRYRRGDYAGALPIAKQSLAICKQVLGEHHLEYATGLTNLASQYRSLGHFADAEPLYREALDIREKLLGKEHPEYATCLDSVARIRFEQADYIGAVAICRDALAVREKVFGKDHPAYAHSLKGLGVLYQRMGDFQRADSAFREVMVIQEKVVGKRSGEYASTLTNLAFVLQSTGDYAQSERLLLEAIAIQEELLGKDHPDYATSLVCLAALHESEGRFMQAEPLYRQAMTIREKTLGNEHPTYALSLHALAVLNYRTDNYRNAVPLCEKALAIRKKILGEEHPDYGDSLNLLATIYNAMGDHSLSESLYRQALEISEKVLGKEHPDYAAGLTNLANVLIDLGKYRDVEEMCRKAIAINENKLGKTHPDYAKILQCLAVFYRMTGDFSRAEPLLVEAAQIQKDARGKFHPDYVDSLNSLAVLRSAMGNTPQAEQLYRDAINIQQAAGNKQHPAYARSLINLAHLYAETGDDSQAEHLYREAVSISLENLDRTADVQSERQQMRMSANLRLQLDTYLSLALRHPLYQERAYAALLRWKGSIWQRQLRQQMLRDQPLLQAQFMALQDLSSSLSTLILNPPADTKQRDVWRQRLEEVTGQREKLQRDLSLSSIAFRESRQIVSPKQLQESLPTGTILIDFLEYIHYTPENKEQRIEEVLEPRLLVHLVRGDKEVRAIDLGDVASLKTLVQTWRQDFGQSAASTVAASELKKRIWQPLEKHLDGISVVYVSPDGILGKFPLAVLPGKRPGSYLIEDLAIVILPVPQGLPAMTSSPSLDSGDDRFCLVGGVDYEQAAAPETQSTPTGSMTLAVRGGQWQAFDPLPGTETEINEIESLIRTHRPATQTTILRGGAATEPAFASVAAGHRFLHVASHGFFAPEEVQNAMTATAPERMKAIGDSSSPKLTGQHPDLLSGLVFAGANRKPESDTENDGILTAAEVQSLDLRNVNLAVLSACETSLGSTAGGEGIIGLQRAFQLAGAHTTVTSLWKVDDAATQALMVEFYRNLLEKKLSKLESLRQAQLWMLNNPDLIDGRDLTTRGTVQKVKPLDPNAPKSAPTRSLPAYWAAFQLSGDPR